MITAQTLQHQITHVQMGYPPFYPSNLMTRLNPDVVKNVMTALMMEIQNTQAMNGRPLRVLAFNELAQNSFNNPPFLNLLQITVSIVEMGLQQFNGDLNATMAKAVPSVVSNYMGKLFFQYPNAVQIQDPQTQQAVQVAAQTWQQMTTQVNQYLSSLAGQQQQPVQYQQQFQQNGMQQNQQFNNQLMMNAGMAPQSQAMYTAGYTTPQQHSAPSDPMFADDRFNSSAPAITVGGQSNTLVVGGNHAPVRVMDTSNQADPFAMSFDLSAPDSTNVSVDALSAAVFTLNDTAQEEVTMADVLRQPDAIVSEVKDTTEVLDAAGHSAIFKLKPAKEYTGGKLEVRNFIPDNQDPITDVPAKFTRMKTDDPRTLWPYWGGLRVVTLAYNPSLFKLSVCLHRKPPMNDPVDLGYSQLFEKLAMDKEAHRIPRWVDVKQMTAKLEKQPDITENSPVKEEQFPIVTYGCRQEVLWDTSIDTAWAGTIGEAKSESRSDEVLFMRKVSIAKPIFITCPADDKFLTDVQSANTFNDLFKTLNQYRGLVCVDLYRLVNQKATELLNSFIRNRMSIAKAHVDSFDDDWLEMQSGLVNRYNGPVTIALRAKRREELQSVFGFSPKDSENVTDGVLQQFRDIILGDMPESEEPSSLRFVTTRYLLCHLKLPSYELGIELHDHLPTLVSGSYGDDFMYQVIETIKQYLNDEAIPDGTRLLLKTEDGYILELHDAALLDGKLGKQLMVTKVA